MRLNYIDIPVYAGYRSNDRISVFGGLSAGYLISGNEYNNYGLFPKEDRRPFNDFDVQALAGIRVKFTSRLSLDIRGAYSVVPIRDNPGEVLWYWLDSQFNNVLSTSLFYRLDF
jgi:opacity protein-like surface antigen